MKQKFFSPEPHKSEFFFFKTIEQEINLDWTNQDLVRLQQGQRVDFQFHEG
jgi:hypothetical protein